MYTDMVGHVHGGMGTAVQKSSVYCVHSLPKDNRVLINHVHVLQNLVYMVKHGQYTVSTCSKHG